MLSLAHGSCEVPEDPPPSRSASFQAGQPDELARKVRAGAKLQKCFHACVAFSGTQAPDSVLLSLNKGVFGHA